MAKISVIGAGSWGTALARTCAIPANEVMLIGRDEKVVDSINTKNENPAYLSGINLPKNLKASTDIAEIKDSDIVFIVVPSVAVIKTIEQMKPHFPEEGIVILASKGFDDVNARFISNVASETLPKARITVLSGPTFARELAEEKVSIATLACADNDIFNEAIYLLGDIKLNLTYSHDVLGVQLLGAAKNILAVACGMMSGLKLPENTQAAVVTDFYKEIQQMLNAVGGEPETMYSAAGVGDFFLTCTSSTSRNYSYGKALAEGKAQECTFLVEGKYAARTILSMAEKRHIKLPLTQVFNDIITEKVSADLLGNALAA